MVLNRGWLHTIYHYHISSCVWSDTGSERDNETNVDSWRIEFRAFRPAHLNPEHFVWSGRDDKGLTWLSQTNCGWWRKTTYTFEFRFKSSIRIRYFSSCAKQKVKFCWPVLSIHIHTCPFPYFLGCLLMFLLRQGLLVYSYSQRASNWNWYIIGMLKQAVKTKCPSFWKGSLKDTSIM